MAQKGATPAVAPTQPQPAAGQGQPAHDPNARQPSVANVRPQQNAHGHEPGCKHCDTCSCERDRQNGVRPVPYRAPPPDSYRKSYTSDAAQRSVADRNRMYDELEAIAKKARDNPPGPIINSASYDRSLAFYNERCAVQSEDELCSWYDRELTQLNHKTVDHILRSQALATQDPTTAFSSQLDEYRLQLAALLHVYQREDAEFERLRLIKEQERLEDLAFCRNLADRIERGHVTRADTHKNMTEYVDRTKTGRQQPYTGREHGAAGAKADRVPASIDKTGRGRSDLGRV